MQLDTPQDRRAFGPKRIHDFIWGELAHLSLQEISATYRIWDLPTLQRFLEQLAPGSRVVIERHIIRVRLQSSESEIRIPSVVFELVHGRDAHSLLQRPNAGVRLSTHERTR